MIIKLKQIPLYLILLIITFACNSSKSFKNTVVCNISKSNTLSSKILSKPTFIKLIENDSIRFAAPSKLIVTKKAYYIFDKYGSGLIYRFSKDGKNISCIGVRGHAEDEYIRAWDFDATDNNVYIYDLGSKRIIKYSDTGKFISAIKCPYSIDAFIHLKNGDMLISNGVNSKNTDLSLVDSSMKLKEVILKSPKGFTDSKVNDYVFRRDSNKILYNRPINYNLYELSSTGKLDKVYNFNLFGLNAPEDLYSNYIKFSEQDGDNRYAYMQSCPIMYKDIIIAPIVSKGSLGNFVYDVNSQKTLFTEYKKGEFSTDNLLLPLTVYNGVVYGWLDSSILSYINQSTLPKDIISFINNGGKVLVLYKINQLK